MAAGESERRRRAGDLLKRLDLGREGTGEIRREVLVALSDDETPHPKARIAEMEHPISAGASTRDLFDVASRNLHRAGRIDRELRDDVFPILITVGLVEKCHINSREDFERTGQLFVMGEHPVAKSPNSGYVLTESAHHLLVEANRRQWPSARDEWLSKSQARRQQGMRKAASDKLAGAAPENKHTVLIEQCIAALLSSVASEFELVFVDDADGDRVQERWREHLEDLALTPDLASRWPDAILVCARRRAVWFIDAVTSDGELDEQRAKDLRLWAKQKGYAVAGMTTAYESWKRAGSRQASHGNLAVGSTVWIAEDGGKLLHITSLADPDTRDAD